MKSASFWLVALGLVTITSFRAGFTIAQDSETGFGWGEPDLPTANVDPESGNSPVNQERDYVRYLSTQQSPTSIPPSKSPAADLLSKLQLLEQEVMRLNGILEQQSYEIRLLREKSLERYIELDRRLTKNDINGVDSYEAERATTPYILDQSSISELVGEGDAYRSAYNLVKNREFEAAISMFQEFIKNFPGGRYSPNAHYWLGELYLVLEEPEIEAARQSFMLLVNQYPENLKVPDALYKLGKIQLMKGNRERSRYYINKVIKEYSDSNKSVVALAKDFIKENDL